MKIIHCADIHIGSSMKTNMSAEKAKQRKRELLDTFKRMVELASKYHIDAIIIAGDLFDESKIIRSVKQEVLNIILKNNEIDFLYLAGNHDDKIVFSVENETPANLKFFNIDNEWVTYNYDDIKITGIDITSTFGKGFYTKLKLNKDDFNIVVMHGDISKYDNDERNDAIYINQLKNKNIDYLALGHIHNTDHIPQKIDERGIYNYSGCLEGRGFDECGQKGFLYLEVIDKKVIKNKFIPFSKRQIEEKEVDITNCDSYLKIEEAVRKELNDIKRENLIKIKLKGTYKGGTIKEIDRLKEKFNEEYFFCKIEDNSKLKISTEEYEKDISLKGEFIRLVLHQEISEEQKEKIIDCGLKALYGEEIDL